MATAKFKVFVNYTGGGPDPTVVCDEKRPVVDRGRDKIRVSNETTEKIVVQPADLFDVPFDVEAGESRVEKVTANASPGLYLLSAEYVSKKIKRAKRVQTLAAYDPEFIVE